MAEMIPFLGLIGVGYYIWQRFRAKPTAPDAITQPTAPVASQPVPQPNKASAVPPPEEVVEPNERLMTFSELLGWSKGDQDLFKRMFPLTLPKAVRERYEQTEKPNEK